MTPTALNILLGAVLIGQSVTESSGVEALGRANPSPTRPCPGFCPPWRSCTAGVCVCNATTIYGKNCKEEQVQVLLDDKNKVTVKVVEFNSQHFQFVCGEGWELATANVFCRDSMKKPEGAEEASLVSFVPTKRTSCYQIKCSGFERTLSECFFQIKSLSGTAVAKLTCYKGPKGSSGACPSDSVTCGNGKCVTQDDRCDGRDQCGDGTDEMDCEECNRNGILCPSQTCLPADARRTCTDIFPPTAPPTAQAPPTAPALPTTPAPPPTAPKPRVLTDEYLGPEACLEHRFTRLSCHKVFCPPWMRCIEGKCECKLPYLCPRVGASACGSDRRSYLSFCQLMAVTCRGRKTFFSHFGETCKEEQLFETQLGEQGVVQVHKHSGTFLVCEDEWSIAAANVVCRHKKNNPLGAQEVSFVEFKEIRRPDGPSSCLPVRCSGFENTLAECTLYSDRQLRDDDRVLTATCYQAPKEGSECLGFRCASGKCVALNDTCDGRDNCGDASDEMCCKKCRNGGFHCTSNICLPPDARNDGIMDCLGGDDELPFTGSSQQKKDDEHVNDPEVTSNPKNETMVSRASLEKLQCGVPKPDPSGGELGRARVKRVVGGVEAKPTQIQWQVAIQENGKIDCGGAYIGECWVLTAAHCVRSKPEAFSVKFSLWKKRSVQGTTDIVPVEKIIIHPQYNPNTYQNDIALLQLKKLPFKESCLLDNPGVSTVCVPWSVQQFQPGHTCSISGWGRTQAGKVSDVLLWANVSIIPDCAKYYKQRYFDGMECAGDLDGQVDSCQGDSGGPLVCADVSGVSYLWGIVSWGEKCGVAGYPGVYTKVVHYFEWVRSHTTWGAVSKYNL